MTGIRRPIITDKKKILTYNITHDGRCNAKCDCVVCSVDCSEIYKLYNYNTYEEYENNMRAYYNAVREKAISEFLKLYDEAELMELLL